MHLPRWLQRFLSLATLLPLVYSFAPAQQQLGTATVHLKFVNFRGRDLGEGTVTLFERDEEGAKNFASAFRNNVASELPFGIYHLRAYQRGFYSADQTIPVYKRDAWAVIELDVGVEGGNPRCDITGVITRSSSLGGSMWVRAEGLYSTLVADTPVMDGGKFSLAGLRPGTYILAVYQDNRILDITSVDVPRKEPLIIALSDKAGI